MAGDPKKTSSKYIRKTDAEIEAENAEYWTEERMRDAKPRPISRKESVEDNNTLVPKGEK